MSIPRQVLIGYIFLLGSALCNVGYHLYCPPALPWSVAPLFFYTFGMSIVAPGATLLVLDLFPRIRGIVASCQSFTLTMLAGGSRLSSDRAISVAIGVVAGRRAIGVYADGVDLLAAGTFLQPSQEQSSTGVGRVKETHGYDSIKFQIENDFGNKSRRVRP